jgi:antagonist of KipI
MTLHVERPGLLTTVQDLGRCGYQHLGVGTSGAMDEVSHRIANLLVGNPADAAALEITLAGPRLRFECDALVAVCGGDFNPRVGDLAVRRWRPVLVRAGSVLEFGPAVQGARCCLAVAGGVRVPPVLGSASTSLVARFGGLQGRPLAAGDRLAIAPPDPGLYPGLQWDCAHYREPARNLAWFAAWYRELDFLRPARLRFIPGPQWPLLTGASRDALLAGPFRAGARSDRMGIRLQGPVLELERPLEMLSSGVAAGTLQLPPDGNPILLMADRQTTGGYPRLGEVAAVDLPKAAQLRPGEELRFEPVSVDAAQALLLQREARLRELAAAVAVRRTR